MNEIFLKSSSIIEKEIYSLAQINSEYVAYNNMMLIIASYAAQKNHFDDLAAELVGKCSNGVYVEMWNRWVARKGVNKG